MDDATERYLTALEREAVLAVVRDLDGAGITAHFAVMDPETRLSMASISADRLQVTVNQMLDGERPAEPMKGAMYMGAILMLRAISVGFEPGAR